MPKKREFKGKCPDYDSNKCDTKCGVYVCWDTDEHRDYRCPIIDYSPLEEDEV